MIFFNRSMLFWGKGSFPNTSFLKNQPVPCGNTEGTLQPECCDIIADLFYAIIKFADIVPVFFSPNLLGKKLIDPNTRILERGFLTFGLCSQSGNSLRTPSHLITSESLLIRLLQALLKYWDFKS